VGGRKGIGDWDPAKANPSIGLTFGVSPGTRLGIRAGIAWMYDKGHTEPFTKKNGYRGVFRGWKYALLRYGPGPDSYANKVMEYYIRMK
jgi:hypothetical protein